jgi:hypothetical protein
MTLLERMDWFAHVTRLDRIAFMDWQPRTLRWIPLLPIIGLVGSFVMIVHAEGRRALILQMFAAVMVFCAFYLAANLVRLFGPRLVYSARHPLDERELAMKARAGAISGNIIAVAAMFGCFYMALTGVIGGWRPTPIDWVYLGLGLQGVCFILPTLIASWLLPRRMDEADDE